MNIYKFEFSMLKKSILIWSLAIPFGLVFYMLFYPMIATDTAALESIMANFPEEFLALFGMNSELPISSLKGYLALTFGMIYIPIALQASNYGFHILSVEERELTADFLLTKPVKRSEIFISKVLASFTSLLITNVSIAISTILVLLMIKGDETLEFNKIFILLSSIGFIQLVFFSISILISVSLKKISSVLSFSMALGFGLYILSGLGSMLSFKAFSIISPYAHFDPAYILVHANFNWSLVIYTLIIIIIALPLSYVLYLKRNIASL